jgi:hypothetical protein
MILHELRQQAGSNGGANDQILREIWLGLLPERTCDMLATVCEATLIRAG